MDVGSRARGRERVEDDLGPIGVHRANWSNKSHQGLAPLAVDHRAIATIVRGGGDCRDGGWQLSDLYVGRAARRWKQSGVLVRMVFPTVRPCVCCLYVDKCVSVRVWRAIVD
eukprot:COSAG06_NODE_10150_length_1740_cov_1.154784_2_plen_111_part_01